MLAGAIIIGIVVVIAGLLTGVFQWATNEVLGLALPNFVTDWNLVSTLRLDIWNTLVPFSEMTVMFSAWIALLTAVWILRWIKSFIPTVAN